MNAAEMTEVAHRVKIGDELKLVFTQHPPGATFKESLRRFLEMMPFGLVVSSSNWSQLHSIASGGVWSGDRSYTFVVGGSFSPHTFVKRGIESGLLEHVELRTKANPVAAQAPR